MSEALIIGGGLAGGAAAAMLAASGRRVHLLERESEPRDKVCGEFLSGEAQGQLRALGLEVDALGGAPIGRMRLVCGRRCIEAPLPFAALGLTRRRLDAALLDHAGRLGACIERGVTVRSLAQGGVDTPAGTLRARAVLLASGKHEVRGAGRDKAGTLDALVGFKMYFRLAPCSREALDGHIEVVLFEGGYAGLQLVEDGVANLCLVIERRRLAELGRSWEPLFAELMREPHLARRLADAQTLLARPLTIAGTPYGYLYRARPGDDPALYRLGDQAAVIPSFCGDGMSIALHSGRLAARAVTAGRTADSYHARLRADVSRQVSLATALQRLASTRLGRGGVLAGAAAAPAALRALAAWTRVPDRALRRAAGAA